MKMIQLKDGVCEGCIEKDDRILKLEGEIAKLKKIRRELRGWDNFIPKDMGYATCDWFIEEFKQDKQTGKMKMHKRYSVENKRIVALWGIISGYPVGEKFSVKRLWSDLLRFHRGEFPEDVREIVTIENFNGSGKYRASVYYPFYYLPIRVIQHCGCVRYGGGKFERLKEKLNLTPPDDGQKRIDSFK